MNLKRKELIWKLRDERKTIPQICKILGVGKGTVGYYLKGYPKKEKIILTNNKTNNKELFNQNIIKICKESINMSQAADSLNISFSGLKYHAKKLGCWIPNNKNRKQYKERKDKIWDIEKWNKDVLIPISRGTLRRYIINLNLIEYKCNSCGLDKWLNNPISLELNHINGKSKDNRKSNLEFLCPNCHSLTDSWKGKNKQG